MKTLALLVTLALHSTGLWNHVPTHTRASLTSASLAATQAYAAGSTPVTTPAAVPALPLRLTTDPPAKLNAASAFAVDVASGTVLYTKDPGTRRPIASVTKLATILVILSRHAPTETVTIPKLPAYGPDDERLGLVAGETYSVADLVRAALINSANDAADALALWDAGTQPKFAAQMNAKMAEWGITNAHFTNPTGLQDAGNYASAESLAKIAQLAITNPFIRTTVGQTAATITSGAGRTLNLETTDDLLASGEFYGIKTGYTLQAGECFVGLTRISGHEVITVVLDAGDRFGVTQDLANWIGHNYQWL